MVTEITTKRDAPFHTCITTLWLSVEGKHIPCPFLRRKKGNDIFLWGWKGGWGGGNRTRIGLTFVVHLSVSPVIDLSLPFAGLSFPFNVLSLTLTNLGTGVVMV